MAKARINKFKALLSLFGATSIIVASCTQNANPSNGDGGEQGGDKGEGNNPDDGNGGLDGFQGDGSGPIYQSRPELSLPNEQVSNQFKDGKRVVSDQYGNYDAYLNLKNVAVTRGERFDDEKRTPDAKVTNPNQIDKAKLAEYDAKAKQLGLPTYKDAFGYGFLLPNINKKGDVSDGLVQRKDLPTTQLIPKYYYDSIGETFGFGNLKESVTNFLGLPRTILNDNYRKFSKTTYSVYISNKHEDGDNAASKLDKKQKESEKIVSNLGTTWIFDYKLPEKKGEYPTTWYLASNFHVFDNLLLPKIKGTKNDFRGFENRQFKGETEYFQLTFVNTNNKDAVPNGSRFATTQGGAVTLLNDNDKVKTDDQFNKITTPYISVNLDVKKIRPIFLGNDFLKDSSLPTLPNDYKGAQSSIDFAVVEVTFDSPKIAEWVTGGYANWDQKDKYTFAKSSLLEDKTYESLEENSLYAIGFPNSYDDYKIRYNSVDGETIQANENFVSYWTNKEGNYYGTSNAGDYFEKKKNVGGDLNWSNSRTFVNKPGLTDLLLSFPSFNGQALNYSRMPFANVGLGYLIDNYVPAGGASGTRIIDSHNRIQAILFGAARTATTGYATAIRSEGMDYQGLYGKYNLPQYDLIYGGGKDQKDSYFNEMKIRQPKTKTYLFPEGFEKGSNPEYAFKN
ncbi:Ig-specific serine endopeptidase MIP [Mycoplasma sp. E35C]|uniref:Ig-specific serine endopeptidase MIP n=1 Tax=Mycoplasma sp. E35C TaxID=2801918 RepID=UPI001CA45961|nr:DUF31 family protein [Mycoplasma sp. E35C]QZX49117.1 DUF31 family protein [Mycoplasma sp. E35C]